MKDDANALATLLVALALLQQNQRTHVNHEIMNVLDRLKQELGL